MMRRASRTITASSSRRALPLRRPHLTRRHVCQTARDQTWHRAFLLLWGVETSEASVEWEGFEDRLMGTLFAPLPVIVLITVGAVSVYVGTRLASRASHLGTRIAMFSLGSIATAALLTGVVFALGVAIINHPGIAVPTIALFLVVALIVWTISRPDIFGRSDDE